MPCNSCMQRGIFVAGLREEIVVSPEQVLDLMTAGESMDLFSVSFRIVYCIVVCEVLPSNMNSSFVIINYFFSIEPIIKHILEFIADYRHVGETNMNAYSSRSHSIFRMVSSCALFLTVPSLVPPRLDFEVIIGRLRFKF